VAAPWQPIVACCVSHNQYGFVCCVFTGTGLGTLSRDKNDGEEVSPSPLRACLNSTERRCQLHTAAGMASRVDALCTMQGEARVGAITAVPVAAQTATVHRGHLVRTEAMSPARDRQSNAVLQIFAEAAALATSLGGQQRTAKHSRNDMCAAANAMKTKRQQSPTEAAV